jgi:hypothetical protein
MSNPTTNYMVEGVDLSNIFMPLAFGTAIDYNTNYNIKGYGDLSTIFAKRFFITDVTPTLKYTHYYIF